MKYFRDADSLESLMLLIISTATQLFAEKSRNAFNYRKNFVKS